MNAVALLVGLSAPLGATVCRSFRSCLSRRSPLRAANPSVAWCRSVAQPGSAPDLGTVVPVENPSAFSTTSHAPQRIPWYIPWDFLRETLLALPFSLHRQPEGKYEMSYRGVFFEWKEEWSQFVQRCNWYTFHPILIEIEDERNMGGFEVTVIVLGLGFRVRWNYEETEQVKDIVRQVEEIKAQEL